MLLRISAVQKNEVLVLFAWGCGAFGCSLEGVAKIFRHIIITEFNGTFREIIFAILGSNYERFLNGWTSI